MYNLRFWITNIAVSVGSAILIALLGAWFIPKYFNTALYWSFVGTLALTALACIILVRVIEAIVNRIPWFALQSAASLVLFFAAGAVINALLATWFVPNFFDAALYWSIIGIITALALVAAVLRLVIVIAIDRHRWRVAQSRSAAPVQSSES